VNGKYKHSSHYDTATITAVIFLSIGPSSQRGKTFFFFRLLNIVFVPVTFSYSIKELPYKWSPLRAHTMGEASKLTI